MLKYLLFFLFGVLHFSLLSQEIRVKLFAALDLKTVNIDTRESRYELVANSGKEIKLRRYQLLRVQVSENRVQVSDQHGLIGFFEKITFKPNARSHDLAIETVRPNLTARFYDGLVEISVLNGKLFIVNVVDMENYVAGVVEAESGPKAQPEFYKAQAIICRTYALSHLDRHKEEPFNLCDDVHCQVYKGKPRINPDIVEATLATAGLVLVDTANQLIIAAFHSNCGGQTINSEDVWSKPTSYLKSVSDTFCLKRRNAIWRDSIKLGDWFHYLDSMGVDLQDSVKKLQSSYFQQTKRQNFLAIQSDTLPLKVVRKDFKFKSAFFSFSPSQNFLVFEGRGYGHGVGLCQEGAMQMADEGFSYLDILAFYYQNVFVTHVQQLNPVSE